MFKQEPEKREYEQKLLDVARVVRVVAGGRRFRFRTVVVIGNRKGRVGVGVAKGQDISIAVEKAVSDAKKHLIEVKIVNGTISHQVEAKFSAAKVLLKPGVKGRGIVAGGAVRVVCDLAGIENLSGKILGKTKNKLNNARVTIKALQGLKT
jgi:small subunit ribosomal protein S5